MKEQVERLYAMSQKPERQIVGLMSGTSLDGLDVALCAVSGAGRQTKAALKAFETVPYDESFRDEIKQIFAKKNIDFQQLTLLNVLIAERHAAIVNDCLKKWGVGPADIDLIASHGQTVFHAPRRFHGLPDRPNATLQIGDGDHIARRTGIITVSDFRQKHVAAGGEGAPLALYGDYLLLSDDREDRFLLNIGGIANFTFLPASGDTNRIFATDTGPGNTLLNHFARRWFDVEYDRDAGIASQGETDPALLNLLLEEAFFKQPFPKTTGPEQFSPSWVEAALARLPKGLPGHNPYHLMATLTELSARVIADAVQACSPGPLAVMYASGGGLHNPLLMRHLKRLLPLVKQCPLSDLGVNPDAKEAILFAVLANENIAGSDASETPVLGGIPMIGMGKISFF